MTSTGGVYRLKVCRKHDPVFDRVFTSEGGRRLLGNRSCGCRLVPAEVVKARSGRWTVANAFYPTGKGGGVDPHCTPGGTRAPIPHDVLAGLTHVSALGGSTGAKLMADGSGTTYVVKSGANPGHLKNEAEADALYRAAGAVVPKSVLVHDAAGNPVKVARYLDGYQTLGNWEAGKTGAEKAAMLAAISKHALTDVLFGNWDVIGASRDNVLVSPSGTPVRVDNGGSLAYRAQGKLKAEGDWEAGSFQKDLAGMASAKNPAFLSVTKHLPADGSGSLGDQAVALLNKRDAILAAASPATREVLEKRFAQMAGMFGPSSPPAGHGIDTGEKLASYVKAKADEAGVKFTPIQLKKMAWLNASGLGPVAYLDKTKTAAQDAAHAALLAHVLPAGTLVKHVTVSSEKVMSIPFDPSVLKPLKKSSIASGGEPPPGGPKSGPTQKPKPPVVEKGQQAAPKEAPKPPPPPPPAYTPPPTKSKPSAAEAAEATNKFEALLSPPAKPAVKSLVEVHGKDVLAKMSAADRGAVKSYTGSWASSVNYKMRKCPPDFACVEGEHGVKMRSLVKTLDAAPPLPAVTQVYRGIRTWDSAVHAALVAEYSAARESGDPVRLPSFTSTSVSRSTAENFGSSGKGGILYDIKARTGVYVASVSGYSEKELLKSPSAKYRILHVEALPGKPLYVRMEEVL